MALYTDSVYTELWKLVAFNAASVIKSWNTYGQLIGATSVACVGEINVRTLTELVKERRAWWDHTNTKKASVASISNGGWEVLRWVAQQVQQRQKFIAESTKSIKISFHELLHSTRFVSKWRDLKLSVFILQLTEQASQQLLHHFQTFALIQREHKKYLS